MNNEVVLETERLLLRRLDRGDLNSLSLILQDEVVMRAYEGAFDLDQVSEWLDRQVFRYEHDGVGLYGVVLKESGEFIGQCGLVRFLYQGNEALEVTYLFRKEYWHKGYATEAARACIHFAFNVLMERAVYVTIRDNNVASHRVAQRLGLRVVDQIVKHYRGIDMPHAVYLLEREE